MNCADCGTSEFKRDGIGTGYATTSDGQRLCYSCADERQRFDYTISDRVWLYLSSDCKTVTTWSGGVIGHVIDVTHSGRHQYARCHVRVRINGEIWHGTNGGHFSGGGCAIGLRLTAASKRARLMVAS